MYRDGLCRVNDRLYTKTIAFGDINYHLAQNEDKTQIFENYCDFLNYFDSSIGVQLSAINQFGNAEEFMRSIDIPLKGDDCDPLCIELAEFIRSQQAKGNNGLIKNKYFTFGIEADNLKAAKLRAERVEADILNNFKTLGVTSKPLNGMERLEVLHGMFHPNGNEKFRFNWKDVPRTGQNTKDYIAPSSFDFRDGRTFKVGDYYGAVSHLQILAPELTDRMLADFLDLDSAVTVTIHIKSIDQSEAIKTIKRKLSDLDKMKIEEQKKAVRSGYDMDIIPTDLATYGNEAKSLLEDLQSRNERMFLVTIIVLNTAKTKQKLENDVFAAASIAQKYNCALKRLDYQQEQGLMSSLPLGLNQIEIKRGLTTSSVAIFVPFTTCELFQRGEALYYGLNALSNNLIMASRKELKNPNGL
ncbi:MAG: conjugal transfer protein TraE, partial [Firmicutes bacterium]|nr:conjugal transfer protein TraE [Bacillota bacterium]